MAGRIGYFKTLRLGDWLSGPETIAMEMDPVSTKATGWGTHAVAQEVAPASKIAITARLNFQRNHLGVETQRAYLGRRIAWAKALRDAMGFGNGYTVYGVLAIIEDETSDATNLLGDAVPASGSVSLSLNSGIGAANGDWVYISDGVNAEVTDITSVTESDELVATATGNTYLAATPTIVARCLYHFVSAGVTSAPGLTGDGPNENFQSLKLEMGFVSVDDWVDNL